MEKTCFETKIRKIEAEISKLYELIDQAHIFDVGILDEKGAMELPKKKKERQAFLKQKAQERFPQLVKQIQEFDVACQGVALWLDEAKDKLETKQELIEECEQLKDELEEKKSELDF